MRIPRIHVRHKLEVGAIVPLPEQAGEHVARVLRLERGAALVIFNGDGREYDATLASLARHGVAAHLHGVREVDRESPLRLTLAQGVARGEKMDWILQKATELGATRIVPLLTERTEVKLDAERSARRMAHWSSVIGAACEQCGRTRLPVLETPRRLDDWLADPGETSALRLALLPHGEVGVRGLAGLESGALLVVGPEGGLSDNDAALLAQAQFRGLRLGPRVLRTETAGLAALAALQALAGDWG